MKHSGHVKFAYTSLTFLICACAAYAYAYYSIQSLNGELVASHAKVATERAYRSQGEDIAGIYQSTAADRARIGTFFTTEGATVDFIESLESLGSQAGSSVTISSLESVAAKDSTPALLRVHVDAQGSWNAAIKTLKLAEALPYKTTVSRVRMDTSGSTDPKSRREWKVSFTLEAALAEAK